MNGKTYGKCTGFILVGVILILLSLLNLSQDNEIFRYNVKVTAVVSNVTRYTTDDLTLHVDYSYNGQDYRNVSLDPGNSYGGKKEGDAIEIYIDPNDPQKATVKEHSYGYLQLGAGIVLCLCGVAGVLHRTKQGSAF